MYLYSSPSTTRYIWTGCRRCLRDIRGASENDDRVNSETHTEAVIAGVWRYTWSRTPSVLGDTLEGPYRVNLEIHSEIVIEWVRRCISTQCSCEPGDHEQASLEMHLEAVIKRVWTYTWRCTWRPWSSEHRDAHRGCDPTSLEMNLQAVIEQDWRSFQRWSILEEADLEAVDGRHARCWDCIHRLVHSKPLEWDEVTSPVQLLWRTGWWRSICVGRHTGSWIYSQGSTCHRENEGMTDNLRCILYSVYAALGVCYSLVLTHNYGMDRYRWMT